MERIVFLLSDGTRISCMLNPESILIQRRAGLIRRSAGGESISGWGSTDDPVIYTGGGVTEVVLELLFDLAVAGSTIQTDDVRDLTGPLWRLSEGATSNTQERESRLPIARLIWGRTWNIPGVVAEVAERLELFAESGAPRRSFLTMRFLRVSAKDDAPVSAPAITTSELEAMEGLRSAGAAPFAEQQLPAVNFGDGMLGGRADIVASRVYGTDTLWRLVVAANGVASPADDLTGVSLTLLPRTVLGGVRA